MGDITIESEQIITREIETTSCSGGDLKSDGEGVKS
jgi:hypothetical protein